MGAAARGDPRGTPEEAGSSRRTVCARTETVPGPLAAQDTAGLRYALQHDDLTGRSG